MPRGVEHGTIAAPMRHADLLAELPLFDTLAAEDREALAARLLERPFAPGETVFRMGDPGASMYIVLTGAVQIFLPGKSEDAPPASVANAERESHTSESGSIEGAPRVVLKDVTSGEYFGELSLFDDKPRSASVEAITDAVLLELTRDEFAAHLARSPKAALTILSEMAERLRETNSLLSQRAATNALKELEENLTFGQRLADKVAELNGSWAFILFLLVLTGAWSLVNEVMHTPFDRYPYTFFNLLLAILVALQGPLIVMSQNRQTIKDRAQAETDFRVNLKNEVNIEHLRRELAALRSDALRRLDAIERAYRADRVRTEVPRKSGDVEDGF